MKKNGTESIIDNNVILQLNEKNIEDGLYHQHL